MLNDDGKIVASAYGVPPPWIKDIGGAEAWGVLQVGLRAIPGKVKYMIDCQPCVFMIHGEPPKLQRRTDLWQESTPWS